MMEPSPSIIWAAIPIELVTEGLVEPQAPLEEMEIDGRILQVHPGTDGTGAVCRLISGNPQDYLDPRWQPGARVRLHRAPGADA